MYEARSTRNRHVHISAYGAPTAILARRFGFGPKTAALGAAAERQVSFWAKIDTSSQNRRRNTVDRKMRLAIPRRMGFVHRTGDLRIAR